MKNKKTNLNEISRSQASRFIEEMRVLHARLLDPTQEMVKMTIAKEIETAMRQNGITEVKKCTGDAHSNPFIDHCGVCMNLGWGFSGKNVKVK